MAIDTMFGVFRQFEEFAQTAIADSPEVDVQAVGGAGTTEVTAGNDGRLRIGIDASDDEDVGAVTFGTLSYTAGQSGLYMEARVLSSVITDMKYFIGFGDSLATADETTFSATTDTVTIDTQSDAIGFVKDGDSTTDAHFAVAGATDSVTVSQVLPTRLNLVAAEFTTFGVKLSEDRQAAEFYIDGELVHNVQSSSVLVAAVALVPGVWNYEQGTSYNMDVDYLYGKKGRSTT